MNIEELEKSPNWLATLRLYGYAAGWSYKCLMAGKLPNTYYLADASNSQEPNICDFNIDNIKRLIKLGMLKLDKIKVGPYIFSVQLIKILK